MARVFLVLAVLAMLLAGSIAQQQPAHGKSHKSKGKSCAKAFPGCKKCSGSGDDYTCDSCKDRHAIFDDVEAKCVCDSENGYGTLSKSAYNSWKKYNKKSKGKYSAACVLCEKYDLFAEGGKCVEDPFTVTTGRRLFDVAGNVF